MTNPCLRAAIGGFAIVLLSAGAAMAAVQAVPVPEPESLALLAMGVGAVAWVKFRRRK